MCVYLTNQHLSWRLTPHHASSMRSLWLLVPLCLQLSATAPAHAQRADSAQTALVARLYKQFSWEATGGDDGPGGLTFINQSKRVLLQYLEPGLASLLLRDRACTRRSKAICRLDFAPLWDSQDPDASAISFDRAANSAPSSVIARITSSSGAVTVVIFRLVLTSPGWRIADIEYAHGVSLRTIMDGGKRSRP